MQLFVGKIEENHAFLLEEESKHAQKVLRKKMGDFIFVTNGLGKIVGGTITSINKNQLIISVEKEMEDYQKRPYHLHVAMAPTKNIDKFEFFLEKATEIGIDQITPLLTENSERKNINLERLNKIIVSAAKQSLKSTFPILHSLTTYSDFLNQNNKKMIYLAHCHKETDRMDIKNLSLNEKEIIFLIGPEGDFSLPEIDKAKKLNTQFVSLGNQRLRTETAGIFVASVVNVLS